MCVHMHTLHGFPELGLLILWAVSWACAPGAPACPDGREMTTGTKMMVLGACLTVHLATGGLQSDCSFLQNIACQSCTVSGGSSPHCACTSSGSSSPPVLAQLLGLLTPLCLHLLWGPLTPLCLPVEWFVFKKEVRPL